MLSKHSGSNRLHMTCTCEVRHVRMYTCLHVQITKSRVAMEVVSGLDAWSLE